MDPTSMAAVVGITMLIGATQKDTTSLEVKNIINNFVSQTEKQVVNLVTQSVADITHTVVQQQVSKLSNNIDSQNNIDLADVIIVGGSFTLEQQNNLKSTVTAIFNIVQSNEIITQLTNQIKNNIQMSLSQNADLANQVAATSSLLKSQKDSGEFNKMVSETKNILNSVANNLSSNTSRTTIKNNLSTKIILDSDTRASISDYIGIKINQNISQSTLNNCVQSNNAFNQINLNKILVQDTESSFEIIQENILVSFYRCIVSSFMKTQQLVDLSNDILTDASISASQGAQVKNEASAVNDKKDITENTSWLDSFGSMIAIIIIIILIYGTRQFTK
uniref:Uncharacterized protein n=1 Tax=viral metagenome TaxID=1070528 RepID=A0A6C0HWI1_9ZZZZ